MSPIPTLRHPAVTEIMRDESAQPSPLWYEVNDAYYKLLTQIAGINLMLVGPTRGDWVKQLSSSWAQIGAPGEKSDAELKKLRDDLNELKKEIAEENAQARESWKAVVEVYQEDRKALESEDEEWRQDAIKILEGKYADTARAVQIANGYLTFDDLVPLEYMLKEKKHREFAQVRAERKKEGPGAGSTGATGAGLGAVLTYQGKTLVRLGGEKFYISGTPPKGGWTPKGGTTSEFFIYKQSDPKKMYRLDYDTIKMGPKQGQVGWEHNQKGVAKILGLKVTNHQPAGGWGKAAGTAIRIYKWGGRALFVAGLVGTALEIYYAENKARAIAKTGGAIAGGIGGAKLGAAGGAEAGAFFGPVGAGIGAFLGGLIGGGLGAWGGSKATEYIYDLVVEPLEDEDDWVVLRRTRSNPSRELRGAANDWLHAQARSSRQPGRLPCRASIVLPPVAALGCLSDIRRPVPRGRKRRPRPGERIRGRVRPLGGDRADLFESLYRWSGGIPVRISLSRHAGLAELVDKLTGRAVEGEWTVQPSPLINPELVQSMTTYGWEATMWTALPDGEAAALSRGSMTMPDLEQLVRGGNVPWWLSHGYKEPFLTGYTPSLTMVAVADLVRKEVGIRVQATEEPFVPHRVRMHRRWRA